MSASDISVAEDFDLADATLALTRLRATQIRHSISARPTALYVLIDPMLGDPVLGDDLPEDLSMQRLNDQRSRAWSRKCCGLQLPRSVTLDTRLAPYLVELDGPNDPWMDVTVGWAVTETVQSWFATGVQGVAHRVGAWLLSMAPAPELAAMLSGGLCLSTEAPTTARYLRLADRRVWSLMVHVLGAGEVARRLAPIEHWYWLDPHAACRCLSATEPAQAKARAPEQPWVRFAQAQWAVMKRGPTIHRQVAASQARRVLAARDQWLAQSTPISHAQWQQAMAHADANDKN